MGRYYSGDIEGKFWFGVQDSDDASFFGGSQSQPNYIENYFEKGDLPDINEGIEKCLKALGVFEIKIDRFFKKENGYTDEQLAKELGISKEKTQELLTWYARLELGRKIRDCVIKNGDCSFDAEC